MTFGTFVTTLRRRLQDIRTISGTLITDITTSGIRWTSEELIEIANLALIELVRISNVYESSPLLKQIIGSGFFEARGTLVFSGIELATPSDVLAITSLTENAATERSFGYLEPMKFHDVVTEHGAPRDEGFFYTVMFDASAVIRKIVLGASYTGTLKYVAIYNRANYTSSDGTVVLYISGMDDILFDIAEREARDREHNWERSRILDVRIAFKFGVPLGGNR